MPSLPEVVQEALLLAICFYQCNMWSSALTTFPALAGKVMRGMCRRAEPALRKHRTATKLLLVYRGQGERNGPILTTVNMATC